MTHNKPLTYLSIHGVKIQVGHFCLQDIDFSLEKGEYLVLLGQSGAGKTLLLETLAGLQRLKAGRIIFQGTDISASRIQQRPFGLLFQDHAVFPHMTVAGNIAYPLKHLPSHHRNQVIERLGKRLEIGHLLSRMPARLSGGEKQRLALARILAREPDILLLDEPFSGLDVHLKKSFRMLFKNLNREGLTIIHVTHDPEEAMSLASRVGILNNGRLVQFGSPEEVFGSPQLAFVASLSGIQNFIPATLEPGEGNSLRRATTIRGNTISLYSNESSGPGHLLIRGEDIILSLQTFESSALNTIKGTIKESIPIPHGVEIVIEANDLFTVVVSKESVDHLSLLIGKSVWMSFKASAIQFVSKA